MLSVQEMQNVYYNHSHQHESLIQSVKTEKDIGKRAILFELGLQVEQRLQELHRLFISVLPPSAAAAEPDLEAADCADDRNVQSKIPKIEPFFGKRIFLTFVATPECSSDTNAAEDDTARVEAEDNEIANIIDNDIEFNDGDYDDDDDDIVEANQN